MQQILGFKSPLSSEERTSILLKKIREYRQSKGLSMENLAAELGVCRSTVWYWENYPPRELSPSRLDVMGKYLISVGISEDSENNASQPVETESPQTPLTIGKILLRLRLERGYSRSDIAPALGVTPGTIGRWERDLILPLPSNMKRIQKFFHLAENYTFSEGKLQHDLYGGTAGSGSAEVAKNPTVPPAETPPSHHDSVEFPKDMEELLLSLYRSLPPSEKALVFETVLTAVQEHVAQVLQDSIP
jgi:transcriptional regulator with XRE-family HTH domain